MKPVHIEQLSTKKPAGPVIDTTVRARSNINSRNSKVTPFTVVFVPIRGRYQTNPGIYELRFHVSVCHTLRLIVLCQGDDIFIL